jgi:hypothetical protein
MRILESWRSAPHRLALRRRNRQSSWFRRNDSAESVPTYRPDPSLDADYPTLTKIRRLCEVATASAEIVGRRAVDEETMKHEKQRFESAKRLSLELAKRLGDELNRDTALRLIVELCMKANDLAAANILIRGVQTGVIREQLLEEYPIAFY